MLGPSEMRTKSGLGLGQLWGRLGGGSSQEAEMRGWVKRRKEEEKDNTRTRYQLTSP